MTKTSTSTHTGIVSRVDGPFRTRKPGTQRWEVLISLGHHDNLIGSSQVYASTLDPFAADTARQHAKQPVLVTVRNSRYGYDLISIEERL